MKKRNKIIIQKKKYKNFWKRKDKGLLITFKEKHFEIEIRDNQ